jgi:hypothetical protein
MEGALTEFFQRWKSDIKGSDRCSGGTDRVLLEIFLQRQRMLPLKWMGARLGMNEQSAREILRALQAGVLPIVYEYFDKQLVLESFKDDLLQSLKSLRFRTFGSHSDFCRRLHEAVAQELGVAVQALMCHTSQELGEGNVLYAHDFDCITFEPLSVKHSAWLNFGKPLSLPPDRCSKLFLARNLAELQPALAGMGTPDSLELYQQVALGA